MMALQAKLLEVLVCPQCKAKLAQVEGGRGLLCHTCQLKFPVKEGIPIMLIEEAQDMRSGGGPQTAPTTAAPFAPQGVIRPRTNEVLFKVIGGPDAGMGFDLKLGFCRALGRFAGDTTKTTILNVDWAISLDDETKGLILQYISQQFRKPQASREAVNQSQLGAFQRSSDVILKDHTMSRLHAMIFFDDIGVGILDLVSKNGTFVNGEEIESRLLKKGDVIEVGETKIVFES